MPASTSVKTAPPHGTQRHSASGFGEDEIDLIDLTLDDDTLPPSGSASKGPGAPRERKAAAKGPGGRGGRGGRGGPARRGGPSGPRGPRGRDAFGSGIPDITGPGGLPKDFVEDVFELPKNGGAFKSAPLADQNPDDVIRVVWQGAKGEGGRAGARPTWDRMNKMIDWSDKDDARPTFISKKMNKKNAQRLLDLWRPHTTCFWIQNDSSGKVIHEYGETKVLYAMFFRWAQQLQHMIPRLTGQVGRVFPSDEKYVQKFILPDATAVDNMMPEGWDCFASLTGGSVSMMRVETAAKMVEAVFGEEIQRIFSQGM